MLKCRRLIMILQWFFLSELLLGLFSCTTRENMGMETTHSFRIAMLDQNVAFQPPGLGATIESSWPILQSAYPSKVVYTVTEEDIDTYNWIDQTIELSPQASKRFIEFFECNLDDTYPVCTELYSFVSLFDDAPIYGGRFIVAMSPLVLRFPIIYAKMSSGIVTFSIRPFHPTETIELDNPAWEVIRNENVKSIFLELNKLLE